MQIVPIPLAHHVVCRASTICSAERTGWEGYEKEWTDCVQSDIRAFGIAGDWKAMALTAGVWVEAVTESGRSFMAAWRK